MNESATTTRAAERRLQTASRLTALCRKLTLERGLNGFTIEEVCSEVGVSRRTFFNYFPSKEDAVFGVYEVDGAEAFAKEFLARGAHGWPAVLDDLVVLTAQIIDSAEVDPSEHLDFMRMLEGEPKLLARFIGMGRERESSLVELVALREGVATSDGHARASVDLFSTMLRTTAERLSDPDVAADFGGALAKTLAAFRDVLATTTRKAHS